MAAKKPSKKVVKGDNAGAAAVPSTDIFTHRNLYSIEVVEAAVESIFDNMETTIMEKQLGGQMATYMGDMCYNILRHNVMLTTIFYDHK